MDREELTRRIGETWGRKRELSPIVRQFVREEAALELRRAKVRELPNRFARARGVALRRGWKWELELAEWTAIVALPCTYCDGPLEETGSGIDRARNELGYTLDNSRPCCAACNSIKGSVLDESCMRELSPVLRRLRAQGRILRRRTPGRPVGSLKPGARFPCGKLRH